MSGFNEKIITALKEAALILVLSLVLAFAINALRPGGLAIMSVHAQPKEAGAPMINPRIYSADDCLQLLQADKAVFLDAREAALYKLGHLPGALHVPKEKADQYLPQLIGLERGGKVLIAYCDGQGCMKAEELMKILQGKGVRAPGLFSDGWQGWMEKGLPIDEGAGNGSDSTSDKN
jgi:rhodanese-related sulfurtransferase